MRLALSLDAARARRWHRDLAERLTRSCGAAWCRIDAGEGPALPSAVETLLRLDGMLHRRLGRRPGDPLAPADFGLRLTGEPSELTIDLGSASEPGGESLAILYDGVADEAALFAALIAGRAPLIQIVRRSGSGTRILAEGLPSLESAAGTQEAYETVVSRAAALLEYAIRQPQDLAASAVTAAAIPGATQVAGHAARALAFAAARRLYHLCCHAPHWVVGWRHVGDGPDVWDRQSLDGPAWQVLADPGDHFYADPFPFMRNGETHVFLEDLDHRTDKGVISVVPFGPDGPTGPARPVLDLPWHLSYPFMLEHAGEVWMIPESSTDHSVRLYRAERYPDRWVEEAVLLQGVEASDATLIRHAGQWWMFATTRDGTGAHSDCLSLYHAPEIRGPWIPHPGNPVMVDAGQARPAGSMVYREGRLLRPVQDCRGGYGRALGLAEVTRLDEGGFAQTLIAHLPPGPAWPGRRLHTLNRAGTLECIDGSGHAPKSRLLAPLFGR